MLDTTLRVRAEPLRAHYAALSDDFIKTYNMDCITVDDEIVFPVDRDVVFVGEDRFLIFMTEQAQYYVRPTSNDPTDTQPRDGICRYGGYFNSFQEALDTAVSWLDLDVKKLPMCTPPHDPTR